MRHVFLFALLACNGEDDPTTDVPADTDTDTDADTDTDTDTDTDADADADTDTDTDTDTGEAPPPVDCLPNHGIHSATSFWVYGWINPSRTGSREVNVSAYDPANNTATLTTTDRWHDGTSSFFGLTVEEYRCDADGLYLLSRVHDGTLSIPGFPDDVDHNETTYTTPPLLRPNVPVLGETWTRRAVGTFTPDGAAAQAIDTTELFVVSQEGVHHTSAFDPAFIHRGANGTEETWIQDVGLARHPSIALLQSHTP